MKKTNKKMVQSVAKIPKMVQSKIHSIALSRNFFEISAFSHEVRKW